MQWIENIKNNMGAWLLQNKLKDQAKIKHPIPSFLGIQEIGILYNATGAQEEEEMKSIIYYLRDQGKKVWTMGYVDAKTLPYNRKFHINSEYFWKEQLSFFNIPQAEKVGQFANHNFDVLLNLYFEPIFPMQAMSSLCQAKYKMGAPMQNSLSYNDSVIDIGSDPSLQKLTAQMVHYLKVINQHEPSK